MWYDERGDLFMEKLSRSELRYKIMTILYQIFLYKKNNIDYNAQDVIKEQLDIENNFVNEIVCGVLEKQEQLDLIANEYLGTWPISRLGFTDQAIIRMGIYELLYTETPDLVCINEAVELSKNYSDEQVSKIINSVLDKIYHNKAKYE